MSAENVINKVKDNATKLNNDHQLIYENLQMFKSQTKSSKSSSSKTRVSLISDSEFSDYYSEWEAIHKKRPKNKMNDPINNKNNNNNNGWQSCRENTDSDAGYAEFISQRIPSKSSKSPLNNNNNKKIGSKSQCKIKRKLMFGNFLKSKNQSLPDLREDIHQQQNDKNNGIIDGNKCKDDESIHRTSAVAQINAKGFHQSHRSFVNEQGFRSKPLLIKVKPPAILNGSKKPLPPLPLPPSTLKIKPEKNDSTNNDQNSQEQPLATKRNPFLEELNRKRNEILKCDKQLNNDDDGEKIYSNAQPKLKNIRQQQENNQLKSAAISGPTPVPVIGRKPSMFEITNFITKNSPPPPKSIHQCTDHNRIISTSSSSSTTTVHMPIPVNPVSKRFQKPPDYETTLKRLHQKQSNPIYSNLPPPQPSSPIIMLINNQHIKQQQHH
ncbi:hypothetical protein BLA29_004941 [Euroglyphus maynei]|uniref:Uncharacterized protein n=1 Tax=Euroglyphus maynei TaxID=6958 RepID=A0A1Y3AYP1_EURMA|nr:hypothetical protein BLA29_004941 [Euroglyphus maynei]